MYVYMCEYFFIVAELERKVRELHSEISKLEEEKYDWEVKIRKQDFEVSCCSRSE